MDDKDTFHTFGYFGGYIHTCHNRTKGCEEVQVQRYEGDKAVRTKSVHAAKCRITRHNNQEGNSR
jgi:hypothetical protein